MNANWFTTLKFKASFTQTHEEGLVLTDLITYPTAKLAIDNAGVLYFSTQTEYIELMELDVDQMITIQIEYDGQRVIALELNDLDGDTI